MTLLDAVRRQVAFDVLGKPATAGSKVAVPIVKGGQRVATRVVESGNREAKRTWRADCRDAALAAIGYDGGWPHFGACEVAVVFSFHRPKSHYGSGRNARILKPSAPLAHLQDPDATKLWRAAEDALSGVLWADDNLVTTQNVTKRWADRFTEPEGMSILVRRHGFVRRRG